MAKREVYQTKEAWLGARSSGIGASDAAAVLGQSPWKSALALYGEKLGLVDPSADESEAMLWGGRLEPVIADQYAAETGRRLRDHGRFTIFRDEEHPFLFASPDREVVDDPRGPGGVEIKTASVYKAEDWVEEPPLYYQIQVQHQMAVMGWAWASLAVLIGGQRFLWVDVARNDRFIEALRLAEIQFWRRVCENNPPQPDGSESSSEALKRLYPTDDGESVPLPPESDEWARVREETTAEIKRLEAVKAEVENQLRAAIGGATYGLLPSGVRFSYKTSERAGYTVEPATVRTLRRLKK